MFFKLCVLLIPLDVEHITILYCKTSHFNELWLLKQMLASCNQVNHPLTGTLAVFCNELWLLKQMPALCNQVIHSLTGTIAGTLAVFFNELWLLKQMFALCNQFNHLLTVLHRSFVYRERLAQS